MNKVANTRGPLGQKQHHEDDPEYLADVRKLPCVICVNYGFIQCSPTESHHTKCGRFGQRKTPDRQAIPLCHGHHHRLRPNPGENGFIGFHNGQETWVKLYGPDTDYIAGTLDAVEKMRAEA